MTGIWEDALRAALAPARELTPTHEELAAVLALHAGRRRRRRGRAIAAACAAVLGLATYAVPATRAAMDDVYSWISGSDDASPSGELRTAPAWVRHASGTKQLIARNGDAQLWVIRRGDYIDIALGDSVGEGGTVEDWRDRFSNQALVLLGPGAFSGPARPFDASWRRPLFGLVARTVTRVELRYASGGPATQDGLNGGFVLAADARRPLRTLVAYDAAGRELQRLDVSGIDLHACFDVRGCPPGRAQPPA
jgi:hypothetical protein